MDRYTTLKCGCVVTTHNFQIIDWKFNCQPHAKMFDNAIMTHDQMFEDLIFNAAETDNLP